MALRLPNPINPLTSALSRGADYFWRDPVEGEPYSGLGGRQFLLELLSSVDPRKQIGWNPQASGQLYPMDGGDPIMAYPLGGRYAPRTPGLRAEVLQPGDRYINFEGTPMPASHGLGRSMYNLLDEQNNIVASAHRKLHPKGEYAHVEDIWVDPAFRKTPAFFDLYNILSRHGKTPLKGTFANERLKKVFERRAIKGATKEEKAKHIIENVPSEKWTPEQYDLIVEANRVKAPSRNLPRKDETAMDIVNNTPTGALTRQLALALAMERQGRLADRTPTGPQMIQQLAKEHAETVRRGAWMAEQERRRRGGR